MSDNIDQIADGEISENQPKGILGIFESRKAKDATKVVELTEHLTTMDAENTALHETVANLQHSERQLTAELESLRSDYADQINEIEALKASVDQANESAGQQAAQIAAQSHVAPEDLPAADSSESIENTPASEAELEEALQACDNHAERSKLVKQYRNRANN